jgi:hypothetical protein
MRNWPMPPDPLTLTRAGIATWLTDVMIAWKFGEALWRQCTLTVDAMRAADPPAAHRGMGVA